MGDLISRQAAIDAMCAVNDSICGQQAIDAICELPSAQPEIIYCKDCKHYNAGFECLIEGYGIERDEDWYCGDAERREDER